MILHVHPCGKLFAVSPIHARMDWMQGSPWKRKFGSLYTIYIENVSRWIVWPACQCGLVPGSISNVFGPRNCPWQVQIILSIRIQKWCLILVITVLDNCSHKTVGWVSSLWQVDIDAVGCISWIGIVKPICTLAVDILKEISSQSCNISFEPDVDTKGALTCCMKIENQGGWRIWGLLILLLYHTWAFLPEPTPKIAELCTNTAFFCVGPWYSLILPRANTWELDSGWYFLPSHNGTTYQNSVLGVAHSCWQSCCTSRHCQTDHLCSTYRNTYVIAQKCWLSHGFEAIKSSTRIENFQHCQYNCHYFSCGSLLADNIIDLG